MLGATHNISTQATFYMSLILGDANGTLSRDIIWDIDFNLSNYSSSLMDIHYAGIADPNSKINYRSDALDKDIMIMGLYCDNCTNLTVNFDGETGYDYGASGVLASYFGVYCLDQSESGSCDGTVFNFQDETGVYFGYSSQYEIYREYRQVIIYYITSIDSENTLTSLFLRRVDASANSINPKSATFPRSFFFVFCFGSFLPFFVCLFFEFQSFCLFLCF